MAEKVTLLRPEPDDLTKLGAFYHRCRAETDMQLVPDYFRALPPERFSRAFVWQFEQPEKVKGQLMTVDGEWAGFYQVGPVDDDLLANHLHDCNLGPDCGELLKIYLLRDYHKRGLGQQLYAAAKEDMVSIGYKHFMVCTYTENEAAIDFYNKRGARLLKESLSRPVWSGIAFERRLTFLLHENFTGASS